MFNFLKGFKWSRKKPPEQRLEENTDQLPYFIRTTHEEPPPLIPPQKARKLEDEIHDLERNLARLKREYKEELEREKKEREERKETQKREKEEEEERLKQRETQKQREKEEEEEFERRKKAYSMRKQYPEIPPTYQRGDTGLLMSSPQAQEITITPEYIMKLQGQSLPNDMIIMFQNNGQYEHYGLEPRVLNINIFSDRFSFIFNHQVDMTIFRQRWDIVKIMIPLNEEFNDYSVFDFGFYASFSVYRITFTQFSHGITTEGAIDWNNATISTNWPPTDYLNNKYVVIEFKSTYIIPPGFEIGLIIKQKQPRISPFQSIQTQPNPSMPLLTNTAPSTGPIIEELKEEHKEEPKEEKKEEKRPIFQGFSFRNKE